MPNFTSDCVDVVEDASHDTHHNTPDTFSNEDLRFGKGVHGRFPIGD
jgi:hypothetical protein